ncbi:YlmH family RNA-binding protein [Streptococcus panodentis]|uniref:RNA-binding protein n=1 Tax=Streptococcus panodentis TaxID=1581472 RepID=A0ABS5B0K0_9STRE|nr:MULTISPECIES: RNA-binding protein [Streptococcus]KXT81694.1 hypothetical protein STRDD11_01980 [Streptococcus sp. DD11]MBP2621499.1 RNA-binding protein [Streptococcus panodentis]
MIKDIYQHFSHEDRDFIDRSLELFQRVENTYAFEATSFLNPHQVLILKNIGKGYDVQVFASSDYYPSEWAKVLVAPSYYELDREDFGLTLLEISYASKFCKISHAQIMGTLLNQLGIERRTFGDILVVGERAQLFVDSRLAQYFMDNVSKIAKVPVRLKKVAAGEQLRVEQEAVTKDILASSLRLDKLVASTFRLSRSQAAQLISGKHVKMNYAVTDNPSRQVGLDDLISVRRFGRFKVLRENGFSKNGKYKLTVELFASK